MMKKSTINALLTVTALTAASTTFAQTPPTLPPAPAPSAGGIEALEAYLGNMYQSVGNFFLSQNYQPISNLSQTTATNTATITLGKTSKTPSQMAKEQASRETRDNLTDSLTQFSYQLYTTSGSNTFTDNQKQFSTAKGSFFGGHLQNNSLSNLITNPNYPESQASDTLYLPTTQATGVKLPTGYPTTTAVQTPFPPGQLPLFAISNIGTKTEASATAIQAYLKKPTTLNDNNFNFANLISPDSYSPEEEAAAQNFVIYAAQSNKDLTSNVPNLALLQTADPMATYYVKTDPAYLKFAMTVRTLLAIRSMSINVLNQLIQERTPMPGMAQAAGLLAKQKAGTLTGKEKNELDHNVASAMQVEAYQANHRVEDPNWYNSVQNASPADVQRNILIALAEIEHQNFQAHVDRERILAAITATNLATNMSAIDTTLQQTGSTLNESIQTDINKTKPASSKSSSEKPVSKK